MKSWAIYIASSGEFLTQISCDTHPSAYEGFAWLPTYGAKEITTQVDPAVRSWDKTAKIWVDDLAKIKATLIGKIKDDAELKKMSNLTPGGAKKEEYASKAREVDALNSLGGTLTAVTAALGLMSSEQRLIKFPNLSASAAEFGDNIPAAAARVKAGITKSAVNPKIAAREEKLCSDIDKATTVAAVRAIEAGVKWPT